jgi:hypothetical protein
MMDGMRTVPNRARWTAVAALLLLPLLFVGSAFLPGRALLPLDLKWDMGAWKADPTVRHLVSNRLLSDVVVQFYPWDVQVRRLVRAGEMPWRSSYAGLGGPLWANPQTALMSPFTAPRLLFGARGWAVSVYLKFIVAGMSAFVLLRRLGYPRFIAGVCGVVYMCSGYSVLYALHPHTNVFAVLPLLAVAAVAFIQSPTPRRAFAVSVAAAWATSGGHPETLFIGVIAVALMLVVLLDATPRGVWIRVSLAALAGFLMLGVTLVPFALIARDSYTAASRPGVPAGGFRFAAVLGQVLPGFLGTPVADELDLTGMLPNAENISLRSGGFVGAVVLLIMLLALPSLPRKPRLLLIIGLLFLFISLRPPGLSSLLKRIPLLSVVAPEYFALGFVLLSLVPLAAALSIVRDIPSTRTLGAVVLTVALVAAAVGTTLALPANRGVILAVARKGISHLRARGQFQQPPEVYEQRLEGYLSRGRVMFFRRLVLPALCWALAGAALFLVRNRSHALGVALALEMLVFGWRLLPITTLRDLPDEPVAVRAVLDADPDKRWLVAAPGEIFPANLGTEYRVRQVDSSDVLESTERVDVLKKAGFDPMTGFPAAPNPEQIRVLRALGVRFYFSREAIAGLTRIGGGPPPAAGVYEIPDARRSSLPTNTPPEGLTLGLLVTAVGVLLAGGVAARSAANA